MCESVIVNGDEPPSIQEEQEAGLIATTHILPC